MNKTIIIDKLLIHKLDMEERRVEYSKGLIDLANTNLEYYDTKIEKCLESDQIKELIIPDNHFLLASAKGMVANIIDDKWFIGESEDIADEWFELCKHADEMPNSDLLFVECKIDGVKHVLILKLNYKYQPIHIAEDEIHKIVTRQVTPSQGSPVEEAIIIDIENNKLSIIEKKFKFDGRVMFYLNEQYIHGIPKFTDKQKLKYLVKVCKKIDRDYNVVEGDVLAPLYKRILLKGLPLNVHNVVKTVFENDDNAVHEAQEILTDLGIDEDTTIENIKSLDKMCRCKLKLNNDRIVELDLDDYLEGVDFSTEYDENGCTQIIIKNIEEVVLA